MIRIETNLRPRSVAEIFDAALESLRRDFAVLATASLLVNAPLAASILGLIYGVAVLGQSNVPFILPLAALSAALTLARPLAQGAVAVALAARVEGGREPDLLSAYATAIRRGVPTIFAGIAFWATALAGGLVCLFPGIILSGWCALAVPAAAVEGKGPFEAVGRSMKLLRGHAARAIGLCLFSLVLYGILALNAFSAVQGALLAGRTLLGLRTGYLEAILTPANGLFATAVLLAIYLVVEPWKACALYHLHLDTRVRYEALDLFRAAERVAAASPSPEEAAAR